MYNEEATYLENSRRRQQTAGGFYFLYSNVLFVQRCSCITDLKGSGSSESIAPVIIDRLVTYANIFDIVEKFAKAYNSYYRVFCDVSIEMFYIFSSFLGFGIHLS